MRIARFSLAGPGPAYGVVELASDGGEHPDTIAKITGDPLAGMRSKHTGERFDLSEVRLLAPVIPRSKVVGIARNYEAHAAEMGGRAAPDPIVFLKPNTSVIGPGDPIVVPPESQEVGYEGELAVVIGGFARRVTPEQAAKFVFGMTIANDVTARDLQRADDQWARAKGFDTFCPLGPWIDTGLTLEQAGDLRLETRLDGELKQSASTAEMVHPIAKLIAHVSAFTTLLPGDVILTGTPAGVGPMAVGQEVSVAISSLGTLTNPVVAG